MSADSQSLTTQESYAICLSTDLSDAVQREMTHLLDLLPASHSIADHSKSDVDSALPLLDIRGFVDGRGLACPMPLLKTKVALRNVAIGESLYIVATDPNSQADITAFCRQSQQVQSSDDLKLMVNDVTDLTGDSTSLQRFATIYHFIITKTDSN